MGAKKRILHALIVGDDKKFRELMNNREHAKLHLDEFANRPHHIAAFLGNAVALRAAHAASPETFGKVNFWGWDVYECVRMSSLITKTKKKEMIRFIEKLISHTNLTQKR